jgi:hypothetical protein
MYASLVVFEIIGMYSERTLEEVVMDGIIVYISLLVVFKLILKILYQFFLYKQFFFI